MKTVLHVIEQLSDFGGTPRKLLYLTAHHNTTVNRLIFATYRPSSLREEFERHGVHVVSLETTSVWLLAIQILRLIRSNDVAVICTHFTRPLLAGFIASRLARVPFVHNEHSSANYRTGLAKRCAKFCLPFASAVVCNSHHTARTIEKAYNIKQSRLHVIHNPVEKRKQVLTRNEIRAKLGAEPNTIVFGHIGGMIASRDQSTLIKAFKQINTKYPDTYLWIIGDGPLRNELEALAFQLDIIDRVSFLGYSSSVGEYLGGTDVYINPTVDEGFGIAVVEAMHAAVPVVLADAGAHPELITHNKEGILYPPSDLDALVSSLEQLIVHPTLRLQFGEAAQERAQGQFRPDNYARAYERVVGEVTAHEFS